jgi:16S rRNA (guanine527-N7)-methyltransferase
MAVLLEPYLSGIVVPANLYPALLVYLDLLLRWNAQTNLTAIREPESIVRRHFGESLFAGACLARRLDREATLLDFGSGAGFPGLPIQLLFPKLRVTLAESQGKKSAFLREAVRSLGLRTEVWAGRVEEMPAGRRFAAVTLRAVDRMPEALALAEEKLTQPGWLMVLSTDRAATAAASPGSAEPNPGPESFRMPGLLEGWVNLYRRG